MGLMAFDPSYAGLIIYQQHVRPNSPFIEKVWVLARIGGGQNWTGDTDCEVGSACQVQNPYYSQCLPIAQPGIPRYGQCGGQNWTGGTTCAAGSTCQVLNPYYSQCLAPTGSTITTSASPPATTTSAKPPTSTTSAKPLTSTTSAKPPASTQDTVPLYGQCGGQNWTGGTTCAAGSTCQVQNPYYSQCLAPTGSTITTSANPPATSTSAKSPTSTTSAQPVSSTSPAGSDSGTIKASFTYYGAGDTFGSPNCNTNTAACGFYTYPGYSAAISENYYGVGPGAGAGPACGTCWKLTGQTDSSGNKLSNAGTTIVVMVNNLCPAQGNPLCSQNGKSGTNSVGANVNFDLCRDSGAAAAFFGNSGTGLAVGTAVQVDCSQWSGTVVH